MEPKGGGSINYKDGPLMNVIAVRCVGHIIHLILSFLFALLCACW